VRRRKRQEGELAFNFSFWRNNMASRWKQRWLWILVGAAVLVPAAAALCYKNVTITYTDGSRVRCGTFCIVEEAGWICAQPQPY
jgi:hypothetical protein